MIKRLIPWIFIAGVVSVLVGLGAWQLERLAWKQQLMAQYEEGQLQPPLPLSDIPSEQLKEMAYRHVTFKGEFLHDKEVHLGGRRWNGKTGYHILTPLRMADGRIFLVNRGWIPFELKELDSRPDSQPTGTVSLSGTLRIPKPAQLFTPENHPEKNFWFTVDFPAIEKFTALSLQPVVVELTETTPDINRFPITSDGERVFRNDHLGYAITWFSLAIAALVIFLIRIRR